jgi:hypothetical protein
VPKINGAESVVEKLLDVKKAVSLYEMGLTTNKPVAIIRKTFA